MIQTIKKRFQREVFHPTWLSLFTNWSYFARRGLAEHIQDLAHNLNGKLVDVGCGTKPYEEFFSVESYTGLEFDTAKNRDKKSAENVLFYSGGKFPLADAQFDSALATQVLEHVFEPDLMISEINRVLKPGGKLLLTVPFVWDEHEQPYDYARYSSFGLKYLLEQHGFEILELRKSISDMRLIFQLINAYLYKISSKNIPSYKVGKLVLHVCTIPINLLGLLFGLVLPANKDLYLDNIVLARKK